MHNKLTVVEPGFEMFTDGATMRALLPLVERAGRTCYKSEDKTSDVSAEKFITNIVKRGHMSVIEHGCVTVKYICSRACSHQLVRHRIAAYSQESQRYCDYSPGKKTDDGGLKIIVPPEVGVVEPGIWEKIADQWENEDCYVPRNDNRCLFLDSVASSYGDYLRLREKGIPPEDARFLIPNACKTEVTTTFNLRQWYHVFEHRALNPRAQWELKGITSGILREFAKHLPCIFGELAARLDED